MTSNEVLSAFAVYKTSKSQNQTKKTKKQRPPGRKVDDGPPRKRPKNKNSTPKQFIQTATKLKKNTAITPTITTNGVDKSTKLKLNKIKAITTTKTKKLEKVPKAKKTVKRKTLNEKPPRLVPIPSINNIGEKITNLLKTDPSPDGLNLFKWLVAPISPEKFFKHYWEKKTLYVSRNKENYYSHVLTTHKLDGIFREFPLYYTRNVDVVTYENGVKEVHNGEGRAVASALYDYYSNGCSIRVLNPQTYDQKVHLLLATLQEYFGSMVGANLYLTPPGSQGFAPHYDDIEAFVLQLEGRKHWKLYKPSGKDVLARDSSPNLDREQIGEPFSEITLNAGDLLYFPRGTIHEGRTDADSHSFHVTISVYQHNSYADLLQHALPSALKRAAEDELDFRKGLPLDFLRYTGCVNRDMPSEMKSSLKKTIKNLTSRLLDYLDIDEAVDVLGRKFMRDSMPPVLSKLEAARTAKYDGDFLINGKVLNRVEIEPDTEVRLLRYHCLRLAEEKYPKRIFKIYYNTDNAKVYHGEDEQFLEIDEHLVACVRMLQRRFPSFVRVEDLPSDDGLAKAQLVSDLWERGLLVTDGPLPSISDGDSDEDL